MQVYGRMQVLPTSRPKRMPHDFDEKVADEEAIALVYLVCPTVRTIRHLAVV